MENPILGQCPEGTVTYDYRMYDRIWQRVSPDLNPYPDVRAANAAAAKNTMDAPPVSAPAAVTAPAPETPAVPVAVETPAAAPMQNSVNAAAESQLPGAEMNPCCMGTQAKESLEVLEGFIEEELAERRCCLSLCRQVHNAHASRLLRRIATGKQCAAREMCTAYYLISGQCYSPTITVEQMQWDSLAAALRSCYHQEACNGFNYARAADGTVDLCLQKLFTKLSQQSYQRADEVMCTLGQVLC